MACPVRGGETEDPPGAWGNVVEPALFLGSNPGSVPQGRGLEGGVAKLRAWPVWACPAADKQGAWPTWRRGLGACPTD